MSFERKLPDSGTDEGEELRNVGDESTDRRGERRAT